MTDSELSAMHALASIGVQKHVIKRIERTGCNRHGEQVVAKGQGEVLLDVGLHRLAQVQGAQDGPSGRRGPGTMPALSMAMLVPVTHGDTDVGLGQSRSVVYAVAGHGHYRTRRFLQFFDEGVLLGRPYAGSHFGDAEVACYKARRWLEVAGQHVHLDAQALELVDGGSGAVAHLVRGRPRRPPIRRRIRP